MEIDPADPSFNLIKADIVEPFKASTLYTCDPVVWYQEPLLPSHEYILPLPPAMPISGARFAVASTRWRLISKVDVAFWILRKLSPSREAGPVLEGGFVGCGPIRNIRL